MPNSSSPPPLEINILVVDDVEKNIKAMQTILQELPVNIHTALSGEQALKLALRHRYAVIFLDVQMPAMDGYEVAECLSKSKSTSKIPIVFVTAIHQDLDNVLKGYDSGGADYLTKPIDSKVVLAKAKIFIKLYRQQEELSSAIKRLDQLANADSLTGLANRHQFNLFFDKLLALNKRQNAQFGLLLLDLDNFKTINDTLGHDVGDELLKSVSKLLQKTVRESDMIARLGGDEFAILLPGLHSPLDLANIAQKIIDEISHPLDICSNEVNITVSIGVATYPFAGDNPTQMFKAADIALYRAKGKGKNIFEHYTETLNEVHRRRAEVETALRHALENSEIHVHYQPRIKMKDKKMIGVEALARWNSQSIGNVSPAEFIPIAEDAGLIYAIGDYLLEECFKQLNAWEKAYPNIPLDLSINLSPTQFLNPAFLKKLQALVTQYAINLNRIEFEITESAFKGENNDLERLLSRVCDLGAHFSIDDFGTGYSSLSRLKALPIKGLKIDQSFVRDTPKDKGDCSIVNAIIALAEALGLEVVAEGVETAAQAEFLLNAGCLEAQGYLFSRPVTAAAIAELLAKGGQVD